MLEDDFQGFSLVTEIVTPLKGASSMNETGKRIAKKATGPGRLKKVSQGLYRNTSSLVYTAHFRVNGQVVKESLKTTDAALAKRKLSDLRTERENLDPKAGKQTLREITERHLMLQGKLSKSSITKKNGIAKTILTSWPGGCDKPALGIKKSEVEEWLLKHTKDLRNSTRNEWLFFIKGVFKRAVEDGVIAKSPAEGIERDPRQAIERLTPTTEEFQIIVDSIRATKENRRHEQSADFVEFMGLSGLGNGEVAALAVRDVNLTRKQIRIERQKTDTEFHIPIFPRLMPLVERLMARHQDSWDAKLLEISEAKHAIESACRRLGYPKYTQRSFRRMFITDALERGVDVKTIAEWQGHKDGGKLILDTYSHVRRPHHDRMAELMK